MDFNPYASPKELPTAFIRQAYWRLIPAAISFLVGGASFLLGLMVSAEAVYIQVTGTAAVPLIAMLAECCIFIVFGICWMLGGWFVWKRRFLRALFLNCLGVGVAMLLIVIFSALF